MCSFAHPTAARPISRMVAPEGTVGVVERRVLFSEEPDVAFARESGIHRGLTVYLSHLTSLSLNSV